MKRWLLAATLLTPALPVHAGTLTLPPFTVGGPTGGGPPSACPDDDGSAGATPGVPNLPGALAAYKDANTAHRLGCKIVGVDFHAGATGTLKVPTSTNLPAGCSLNGNVVRCSGSNWTFSGYEMSGKQLDASGSNVTIKGNRWKLSATNCLAAITYEPTGTWHIEGNTVDGADCGKGMANGLSAMVYNAGGTAPGAVVYIRWNEFLNTPEDTLNLSGPSSGALTAHIDFNYWKGQGSDLNPSAHPDGIQFTRGNFNGTTVLHNTYVNTRKNNDPGIQPLHLEAQLTSKVTKSTTAYNTVVMPGDCQHGNNWPSPGDPPPYHCVGNFAFACKNDAKSANENDTNDGYDIHDNFVDATGLIAATATKSYDCTNTKSANNIDMTTGLPFSNID